MKTRILGIYVLTLVLTFSFAARAQGVPSAYDAGFDKATQDSMMYGYSSAAEAYNALGYSIFGPEFKQGYYDGYWMTSGPLAWDAWYAWWSANYTDTTRVTLHDAILRGNLVQRGANRLARGFRRLSRRRPARAGDWFQDASVTLGYSYAKVVDNVVGGAGHDQEGSAFCSGMLGDRWRLGIGLASDRYEIDSDGRAYEQKTQAMDLLLSYDLTDNVSIGAFFNVSLVDIEDEVLEPPANPWIPNPVKGDHFGRYGGGLMASCNVDVADHLSLGFTGTLASMNKHGLHRLLRRKDTAALFMFDAAYVMNDSLTLTVYGTYTGLIDRETTPEDSTSVSPDGSYWTWGGDVSFALSKKAELMLGLETTTNDNDRDDRRLNASLVISF